jgi:stage V sporulation protein B
MKNKFITSTIILILGGFITKILGFIIKIIYTRIITEEGVSLYAIIMPTYSLLITLATMAMPLSISKLVSEGKQKSINIITSSIAIMVIVNTLIITIMFLLSKYIAYDLLKNKESYILLLACTITLPFISLSSIIKGYFFGKQKMLPYAISNSIEQVVRLILIILFLPKFIKKGILVGVTAFILLSIISEISSIIVLLYFIPKNTIILKKDLKPKYKTIKNVLNVSIPTVSSRLIGNIGFFFEPIILTNILLYIGYDSNFILREYGAYNAYSLGLLTMPSFFIGAISNSLIPEISKYNKQKNMKMVKRRFNQALLYSFILGLLFTVPIYLFRDKLLYILYHTTSGSSYIKVLSPFFILFYLESPIISTLQGLGLSNYTMKITFLGVILKNIILALFSLFHIGIYGLIISEIINIIFVVLTNYFKIKKVISNSLE